MKLRFFIKIFIISSLLYGISSAGLTIVKNFTGQTATTVYKLGKFSEQGSITVKNLVNQKTSVLLFTGESFKPQDFKNNTLEPLTTVSFPIAASTFDQYLSAYQVLGKISIEVKKSNGEIVNPID